MCGVVKYRVEKDGESHPFLVAEESHEYRLSIINSPENAVDLVNNIFRLKNQAEEYVYMLASDSKGSVIGVFEVSHGTVNRFSVFIPGDLFKSSYIWSKFDNSYT